MFVCVCRLTLQIPESGSLKAKRQVMRRITDRVKARFNVALAEVDDEALWQRAQVALAVVSNSRRHVNEQMDKVVHFVEEMHVAPVVLREVETLSFNDQLFADRREEGEPKGDLKVELGQRSLAEAEGLGAWEDRHQAPVRPRVATLKAPLKKLTLAEARARARALRNPRDWEK